MSSQLSADFTVCMSSDDVMVLIDFAFKFSLAMVQFLVVVVVVHCVANSL